MTSILDISLPEWVVLQLYRRFTRTGGIPQTYTMGVENTPPGSVDFAAYFAHVESGHCVTLPNFSRGQLDVKTPPIPITKGILKTYGYQPGRRIRYNMVTQEVREL